jgi:hypothetical protein
MLCQLEKRYTQNNNKTLCTRVALDERVHALKQRVHLGVEVTANTHFFTSSLRLHLLPRPLERTEVVADDGSLIRGRDVAAGRTLNLQTSYVGSLPSFRRSRDRMRRNAWEPRSIVPVAFPSMSCKLKAIGGMNKSEPSQPCNSGVSSCRPTLVAEPRRLAGVWHAISVWTPVRWPSRARSWCAATESVLSVFSTVIKPPVDQLAGVDLGREEMTSLPTERAARRN